MPSHIIDALRERNFIDSISNEEELRQLLSKPTSVFCGFDPTADSLHLGNLVSIMGLAWFQRYGHRPVALVGGATGMIGDPSGKSNERQLLDEKSIETNLVGISTNLKTILSQNKNNPPLIVNNIDWISPFSYISFLRDVGKLFRLGPMLAKESVRARMESEEGMSYTEFSYQIIQAYDFLHLYRTHQVKIQLGGSDQWGNITAGTELIRKVEGGSAYAITFPLLTRADGQKFGKSEKGAIWLSANKLSEYEFYQHLIRVDDADVIKLLCMLTFLEMSEIRQIEAEMKKSDYIPFTAQKKLAEEVTRLVHGEEGLQKAIKVTKGIAPGSDTVLDSETLESIAGDMPTCSLSIQKVLNQKLVDVLVETGLQSSKGEARRLIKNGGIYLNNKKIEDENCIIQDQDLIDQKLLLLSAGKKNKIVVRLIQ